MISSNSTRRSQPLFLMVVFTLFAAALVAAFHWRASQGLSANVMDMAQVARNLSVGHGFSTEFIRPYSLSVTPGRAYQPDLLHAPLYPFILSWAITFLGARDGVISAVSLIFFVLSAALLFQVAWRLSFNKAITCGTVALYVLCPAVLSAADSGSPLILSSFLLLAMLLVLIPKKIPATLEITDKDAKSETDESTVKPEATTDKLNLKQLNRQFLLSGMLAALCYLTDYASLLYVIPLAIVCGQEQQRWNRNTTLKFIFGFALIALPWWIRNARLTGNPFYTLQWLELVMNSQTYPGSSLLRDFSTSHSLLSLFDFDSFPRKFTAALTTYFYEAPKIPHLYLMPFIVAAFWRPANSTMLQRLKRGLLFSGLLYIFVLSALGRANATYLLPLAGLLAFLGVTMIQQVASQGEDNWNTKQKKASLSVEPRSSLWVKLSLLGLTTLVLVWPLTVAILSRPKQANQQEKEAMAALAKALSPNRAVATDVPWLVAWYADRPAVWIPKDQEQLNQIADNLPVGALYLSPNMVSSTEFSGQWQQIYQRVSDITGYDKVSRPQNRDILYIKHPTLAESQTLVKAKPKEAEGYYHLGRAYIASGNFGAALTAFKKAQSLRPQWFEPYQGASTAYIRLKNFPAALKSLAQAEKRSPRAQSVLLGMAELYLATGQNSKAVQTYERVLADSPNQPIAINNLAFIYSERNENIYRALELAKRAVMSDENNGQNWDTLGWVSYHAGRSKEAVGYLQQATKLLPQNGTIQFHLAKVFLSIGQRAQAKKAFTTALELGLPPAQKKEAETLVASQIG